MLVESVVLILGASVVLYCVLGGADFGAGIVNMFLGRSIRENEEELINRALGPVWEANHVWLIVCIVIMFTGFPEGFSAVSTYFHVPLTVVLVGIVFRGCAFTFRNYDVPKDRWHLFYTQAFGVSSFFTPLMFGLIIAGMIRGVPAPESHSFVDVYIAPWISVFSISVGLFACSVCALLASVYLVGETADPPLQQKFARRAKRAVFIAIAAGALVFAAGEFSDAEIFGKFVADPVTLACIAGATLLLAPLWRLMPRGGFYPRLIAASQAALILGGWFRLQFPHILSVGGRELTFYNTQAPAITLHWLLGSLLFALALVVPALAYLLRTFKSAPQDRLEETL